jgi:trans-2,3-dihydro-3-hydroxyanthranilate isomerase
MQRRYVTVDVFTDRAFGGNPLAVVLDAEGLATAQMQALAREFNYSETTFALPPADPAHTARVRIFTPALEIPFAGHPNIGTAVVMAGRGPGTRPSRLVFEEAAGLVALAIDYDGGPVGAELTAPQPFSRGGDAKLADVAAAVGLAAAEVSSATHPPATGGTGLNFLFAELATRGALHRASPDAARLVPLLAGGAAVGLHLYTRDAPGEGCDLQSRMFLPLAGIVEDPATGSANVALAALLADCDPRPDLELTLRIGQGVDMGRPSLLRARAIKRAGRVVSAHVGGRCVEMMEGTFRLSGAEP